MIVVLTKKAIMTDPKAMLLSLSQSNPCHIPTVNQWITIMTRFLITIMIISFIKHVFENSDKFKLVKANTSYCTISIGDSGNQSY